MVRPEWKIQDILVLNIQAKHFIGQVDHSQSMPMGLYIGPYMKVKGAIHDRLPWYLVEPIFKRTDKRIWLAAGAVVGGQAMITPHIYCSGFMGLGYDQKRTVDLIKHVKIGYLFH